MGTQGDDEPLTPAGRLFLRPEINQIITCVVGAKNPLDIDAIKTEITNSPMIKNPRFSSLLVTDRHGREYWRKTQVDVDRHVIIRQDHVVSGDTSVSDEDAVNDYLADLAVSSPLSSDKPLWEVHLLMAHKCVLFRIHHALGDGIALMPLLLSSCRSASDPDRRPCVDPLGSGRKTDRRRRESGRMRRIVKMVWFTIVYVIEFALRSLWVKDKRTAVSGGDGVELWPRKLATARLKVEDMKAVKNVIPNATINDVFFGVISYGLSRYLDIRSPDALQDSLRMTGLAMVNIRPQSGFQEHSEMMKNINSGSGSGSGSGSRWGNKFGMLLLPVYYYKGGPNSNPLEYLKRAKQMIDRKKLSLEAFFSYKIGDLLMSCFGPKFAGLLNYRIVCNTTFTVSNLLGPQEEVTMVGNPISYIRVNTSSLPHAITMHMVSYAGMADLQILVAKDIIPDPKVLAKCFEDALLQMKEAATKTREE